MTRIVNCVLLCLFMIGAVLAASAEAERRKLRREFLQLAREYGHFPIEDDTKVHVLQLDSEDAMHFRFRVFLPSNQAFLWKHKGGSSGGSARNVPADLIAQLRFRYDEESERISVFHSGASSSGRSSMHSGEAARFIVEHWNELSITTASDGIVESYETDEIIELVRLEISGELAIEFEKRFPRVAKSRGMVVYYFSFGTNEAFAQAAKNKVGD